MPSESTDSAGRASNDGLPEKAANAWNLQALVAHLQRVGTRRARSRLASSAVVGMGDRESEEAAGVAGGKEQQFGAVVVETADAA